MAGHGEASQVAVMGVGVDAVEIARVRTACERTPGLLGRLFTERERATCTSRCGDLRYGGLAGRFAAKEAVAKAFGTGVRGFGWRDVEVLSDDLGRPGVRLHGAAAELGARLGVVTVHLSLTTSAELAIANVVLEGGDG
jgi:holo-[acyl-carrier protein] synthase